MLEPAGKFMMQVSYVDLLKRTLIIVSVALVPVLVWYLFNVVLITFGAIIFAMLLWLGAEPFIRWLSIREGVALVLSGLIILLIVVTVGVLLGTRVVGQMLDVIQRAGSATSQLQDYLASSDLGKFVLDHFSTGGFSLTGTLTSVLKVSSSLIEGVVIALISGIYIAAQPRIYRDGFVQLFPPRAHRLVVERLNAITDALRLWLIGQLIQMVLIGVLATAAVWIIGVPSPVALGLIAGFGEFVPYIGPIIAAIPAILVALTNSWQTALWTLIAYLAINQIEGHLIIPLIQRHLVFIPPAVILLGIVAVTSLFGAAAAVFAAPIAVVAFIAVKLLYVRDTLHEPTEIPGES